MSQHAADFSGHAAPASGVPGMPQLVASLLQKFCFPLGRFHTF